MLRGVGGCPIFLDNFDKSRFCLLLQEACEMHALRVHTFCLMSNHMHLLLEPTRDPLKDGVHAFSFRYAQFFNRRHNRHGYLFQGRFRSILVEDGLYLKRLVRYIHLNPVDAGLVKRPEEYFWSSYNAYLGNLAYVWLEINPILSRFGDNYQQALTNFREFTLKTEDAQEDAFCIGKAFHIGIYGDQEFAKIFSAQEVARNTVGEHVRILPNQAITLVCSKFNTSLEALKSSVKTRTLVDARAALCLLAQKAKGMRLSEIATLLGKNYGTVSRLADRANQKSILRDIVDELLSKNLDFM